MKEPLYEIVIPVFKNGSVNIGIVEKKENTYITSDILIGNLERAKIILLIPPKEVKDDE